MLRILLTQIATFLQINQLNSAPLANIYLVVKLLKTGVKIITA